jgi:hypothetical protein
MSEPVGESGSDLSLPDSDSLETGPGEIAAEGRRRFLKEALAAGGAVVSSGVAGSWRGNRRRRRDLQKRPALPLSRRHGQDRPLGVFQQAAEGVG